MIILTPRQADAVKAMCEGYTAVGAAPVLGLHPKTVSRHLDDARQANHCTTVAQLTARYAEEMERTKPAPTTDDSLPSDLPRPLYGPKCILGQRLWGQKQVEALVQQIALLEQKVSRLTTQIPRSPEHEPGTSHQWRTPVGTEHLR